MTAPASESRSHRGATLVELIVTVALLGLVASVTTLAARRIARPDPQAPAVIVADSLDAVLSSGRAMTLEFVVGGRPLFATIKPDGGVVADTALHMDRFTGRNTSDP